MSSNGVRLGSNVLLDGVDDPIVAGEDDFSCFTSLQSLSIFFCSALRCAGCRHDDIRSK